MPQHVQAESYIFSDDLTINSSFRLSNEYSVIRTNIYPSGFSKLVSQLAQLRSHKTDIIYGINYLIGPRISSSLLE